MTFDLFYNLKRKIFFIFFILKINERDFLIFFKLKKNKF